MNRHAAERLEFGQVLAQLARHAETEAGTRALLEMTPDPDPDTLATAQELYRAASRAEPLRRLSLAGAVDLEEWVTRAEKGGVLRPLELFGLGVTIGRGEETRVALEASQEPLLEAHFGRFSPPRGLRQAVIQAVTEEGYVKDAASPRLGEIRREIGRLEAEIDQAFQRLITSSQFLEYLQEPIITMRNGRRVVPVKHHFRNTVKGLVHDQSGSGQTVFIEPLAVVERQNRIQGLRGDEREEIERILAQLTREVSQIGDGLRALSRTLIRLDQLLARVRWAEAVQAELPALGGDRLELRDARHPLLETPVPITLAVGGDQPVLVITGPNTGGKTVSLKCAGLMVMLALSGCPIPAAAGSRVPYFRDVLADIGDEQSLAESLSTFSGHLRQLVPMVAEASTGMLLLVDEIGAGTDPEEGAALAVAVLERFLAAGATVLVTTHFSRVKLLAYEDSRVENAQVEFDRETLRPTYRLVMGQPGSSQALYIAERLGLHPGVVARARTLLGEPGTRVEDTIAQLNRLEQELRTREAELERATRTLDTERARLREAEARFEERRHGERIRERERFRETLDDIRRRAEALMAEARAQDRAERERALESLRQEVKTWGLQMPDEPGPHRPLHLSEAHRQGALGPGDWVEGSRLPAPGQIVAVEDGEAVVALGAIKMRVPVSSLGRTAGPAPEARRARPSGPSKVVPLECDLRGLTVAEALDTVDRYLDEAVLAGLPMARIIHGKGTGALRRAVQDLLREHPQVMGFRLGESGEGGDGVTVVRFSDPG